MLSQVVGEDWPVHVEADVPVVLSSTNGAIGAELFVGS